jgi:hypothetical protein
MSLQTAFPKTSRYFIVSISSKLPDKMISCCTTSASYHQFRYTMRLLKAVSNPYRIISL